jgi:phosphomannomutase/phosphoglucomutase
VAVNPQIFREYDIRGLVDVDLNETTVELIGRAVGTYLRQNGVTQATLGWDARLSSPAYSGAIQRGLLATGIDVVLLGMVPTPVFYFANYHYGYRGGVMVTGSHNPPEFNGFKVACGRGTIFGEEIQKIYQLLIGGDFAQGQGKSTERDPLPDYKRALLSRISGKAGLKVVADAGSGTAGPLAPELLSATGCTVIPLYCQPDGHFPYHHPDPTVPANLKDLIELVRREKADLGIAYDGDADRIGAVDERGNIVFGDRLLALYAREILAKNPGGKIIFEVKCSQALIEDIQAHGGVPIMWKTGHSLIEEKIHQEKALLAGEMSGHIYFADNYYGYDDAIYASLRLVELLGRAGKPFSQLLATLPQYFSTPEIRLDCPDEVKFKVVQEVTEYFSENYDTITVDGVRVNFGDGWGLIRASNTQPVLVLRFEAKTEKRLAEIKGLMEGKLAEVMARY